MRLLVNLGITTLLLLPLSANCASPSAARQSALIDLLQQDCGSCHGMTLKGGLGPSLLPQALTGKPDSLLIETIQNGRPGTAMPPWKPMLSVEETQWLVKRLREGVGNAP